MRFALIFIKWNFWATKLLGGDLGLTADKCLVNNGRTVRSLSSVSPEEARERRPRWNNTIPRYQSKRG